MEQLPVPVTRSRVGQSALLAIVLTIGLAVFAAYAGPRGRGPAADAPSPSATKMLVGGARAVPVVPTIPPPPATPTPGPSPASLPAFARFGDPVPHGRVALGGDGVQFLNLDTGSLEQLPGAIRDCQVLRASGVLVGACSSYTQTRDGDRALVEVRRLRGPSAERTRVGVYEGVRDPPGPAGDQGSSVQTSASISADGRWVYVGTAVRGRDAWELAVAVVDLGERQVIQRLALERVPLRPRDESSPAAPTPGTAGQVPTFAMASAPVVQIAPDGGHVMLSAWIEGGPGPSRPHWLAAVDDGDLRDVKPFRDRAGWLESEGCTDEGFASATTYYAICAAWTQSPRVSWISLDGPQREIALERFGSESSFMIGSALDSARAKLYLWSPDTLGVARVDVLGGRLELQTTLRPPTSGAGAGRAVTGLAETLSNWIAPAAVGKTNLHPAIAVSPDGSRLYAIGVNTPQGRASYPSGLWVVDSTELSLIGRWEATADFSSVAVTADGRFVLACGMPGVDGLGNETDWPASVTGYDARTGEVRLIAGDLGRGWLQFMPEVSG